MPHSLHIKGSVNFGDRKVKQHGSQDGNVLPKVKINSASGTITTLETIDFNETTVSLCVHNDCVHRDSIVLVSINENSTGLLLLPEVDAISHHQFTIKISDLQSAISLPGASFVTNVPIKIGFLVC